MNLKKFLIALAVTSIFNFSDATFNFDENFPSEMKVYAATNQELAKQKYEEGNNLAAQGNYQAAISKYTEAIKLMPNDPSNYLIRGGLYFNLENYKQAITDFNKFIELDQNFETAYLLRGHSYFQLNNYSQAISDYNKVIKLNPNATEAYFYRGKSYFLSQMPAKITMENLFEISKITKDKLNYYLRAIKDFDKTIELNSSNPGYKFLMVSENSTSINAEAYFLRGSMYIFTNNYEQALQDFTNSIKINPNNARAYSSRGYCYFLLHEKEKANLDFEKARELGY